MKFVHSHFLDMVLYNWWNFLATPEPIPLFHFDSRHVESPGHYR